MTRPSSTPIPWKLARSASELEPLLRAVEAKNPALLTTFPRDVERIANTLLHFELVAVPGLTGRLAFEVLANRSGFALPSLLDDGARRLAGFVYAEGWRAVALYDPDLGDDCARLTKAHELTHLVREHVPLLQRAEPGMRKRRAPAVPFFALREPPSNLALVPEPSRGGEMSDEKLREVAANSGGVEILAPYADVVRELDALASTGETRLHARVDLLRRTFGIAKSTARIRLRELGYLPAIARDTDGRGTVAPARRGQIG